MVSVLSDTHNYLKNAHLTELLILTSADIAGSTEGIWKWGFNTLCNKFSQCLSICITNWYYKLVLKLRILPHRVFWNNSVNFIY